MRTESARLICDDQWRTRYQAWLEGTLEHHRYQRHRDASASAVIDTLPLVRRDGDDSAKCAYGTSQWRGFGDSGRDREAALAAELIEWCDRIDHRSVQVQCAHSSSTDSVVGSGRPGLAWSGAIARSSDRCQETSKALHLGTVTHSASSGSLAQTRGHTPICERSAAKSHDGAESKTSTHVRCGLLARSRASSRVLQ